MTKVNFNNKRFKLLDNSVNGKVDAQTIFEYQQEGNLVTADYKGGSVIYGKIIAQHCGDTLKMLYQCYTKEKELKAGKATATIIMTEENQIKLELNWQWLESNQEGSSTYIEI